MKKAFALLSCFVAAGGIALAALTACETGTATDEAIITSVCNSRSDSFSWALTTSGVVRLSTSIWAISGVTYLRPCATVRTACTSPCGSPPLFT